MIRRIILILFLAIFVGLTIWIPTLGRWGLYSLESYESMAHLAWKHFELMGLAELLAILIGVPLGILVTRPNFRFLATPVIGGASMGQAVPSLAVIAFMAPIFGYGFRAAVVALFIYGLLPVVRNAYAGIDNIDPAIIESARGMGMNRLQIARKIELPLARPVIIAGIRTSTVILVGTAALAVLVGGTGLGKPLLSGVLIRNIMLLLQGAAATAGMAVVLDFILEQIENWLTPRGLQIQAQRSE